MAIRFEHAVFGSENGLSDYRVLGASSGVDADARAAIDRYSSLGGTAARLPFSPIFSFYAISPSRHAFARTIHVHKTSRGSDYLVHTILLDADALLGLDYSVFTLADVDLFTADKPALGTVLGTLALASSPAPIAATLAVHDRAACLRAVARSAVRWAVDDARSGVDVCRAVHEELPPLDRLATTFCTRFSHERRLDFKLATFLRDDKHLVREHAGDAVVGDLPPAAVAPVGDDFDRWLALDRASRRIYGLTIAPDPQRALALLDMMAGLARYKIDKAATSAEVIRLQEAAQLVLRPENRRAIVDPSVVRGAVLVNLFTRVGEILASPDALAPLAEACARLAPATRAEALARLDSENLEGWIADTLLRLPDAPLEDIRRTVLRRAGDGTQLAALFARNASACRALLSVVLQAIRTRFGSGGAEAVAALADTLVSEGPVIREFVLVLEATAGGHDPVLRDWLLAIVRQAPHFTERVPQVAARMVLGHGLLHDLRHAEVEALAPSLLALHRKLSEVLAAAEPQSIPPGLLRGWLHRWHDLSSPMPPTLLAVLEATLRAARMALSKRRDSSLLSQVTFVLFFVTHGLDRDERLALHPTLLETARQVLSGEVTGRQGVAMSKVLKRLGHSDLRSTVMLELAANATTATLQQARRGSVFTAIRGFLRLRAVIGMMR